jgi:hypothetical protein
MKAPVLRSIGAFYWSGLRYRQIAVYCGVVTWKA